MARHRSITRSSLQASLIEKPTKLEAKRKPRTPPYKHKLCVEVWTVPVNTIVRHKNRTQWRRYGQLRTSTGFVVTIQKATKDGYLTADFRDWALSQADSRPNLNDLWGTFHDNNGGWNYYDEHLIQVDMADPELPVLKLWRD